MSLQVDRLLDELCLLEVRKMRSKGKGRMKNEPSKPRRAVLPSRLKLKPPKRAKDPARPEFTQAKPRAGELTAKDLAIALESFQTARFTVWSKSVDGFAREIRGVNDEIIASGGTPLKEPRNVVLVGAIANSLSSSMTDVIEFISGLRRKKLAPDVEQFQLFIGGEDLENLRQAVEAETVTTDEMKRVLAVVAERLKEALGRRRGRKRALLKRHLKVKVAPKTDISRTQALARYRNIGLGRSGRK